VAAFDELDDATKKAVAEAAGGDEAFEKLRKELQMVAEEGGDAEDALFKLSAAIAKADNLKVSEIHDTGTG
jgi:hypothetical protein